MEDPSGVSIEPSAQCSLPVGTTTGHFLLSGWGNGREVIAPLTNEEVGAVCTRGGRPGKHTKRGPQVVVVQADAPPPHRGKGPSPSPKPSPKPSKVAKVCTLRERPLSGRLNNCVNFT